MKKLFLLFIIFLSTINLFSQSIGIGTKNPVASALLDVSATNKGFLMPRLSFAQRSAIVNPAAGLIVYCKDCGVNGELTYYNGKDWMNMSIGEGSIPIQAPSQLFITGSATQSGWTNNPPASQQFKKVANGIFELSINLSPGGQYKFLSEPGSWQPQFGGNPFGGSSATGGILGANYGYSYDPDAISTPVVAGNYRITVDFYTNQYSVVKI